MVIQEYLRKADYNTVSDQTYTHIDEWMEWYQGEVEKFHKYTVYNGVNQVGCKRFALGMAKRVCEDWANLLMNEQVKINVDKSYQDRLDEILEQNNFRVRANQLVELYFAMGTGAFVEYLDGDRPIVDYVRADMIYPLSWDNGDITECAFGSTRIYQGKECIYLQIHRLGKEEENADEYYIENRYIDAKSGKELNPPENVLEYVSTGSTEPMFQVLTPNIVNNIDLDSPMGISCYANGIDQLKGCDLVYDSYCNEFKLGKKRVIVPMSMAKIELEKDGNKAPTFDPNDTVFYAMPGDTREGDGNLKDIEMNIRAQEHELGMQRALDMLAFKTGLGTGRYRFENGTAKTATEVVSEKSDLYQNMVKHEIPLRTALIDMTRALYYLDKGKPTDMEITVDFDDSIIQDKDAMRLQDRQDLAAGILRPEEYRARHYNETLAQAKANLPEADLTDVQQ